MTSWSRGPAEDIRWLQSVILRRKYLIVSMVLASLIIGVTAALVLPQHYKAFARVRVDPQRRQVLDQLNTGQNFQNDQAKVDTEVQFIKSPNQAIAVVQKMGLVTDKEFRSGVDEEAPLSRQIEVVAKNVAKALDVKRNENSLIVDLVFKAEDAKLAARVANSFAEEYVKSSVQTLRQQAVQQSGGLGTQMDSLGGRIKASQARLADYRARSGISQGGGGTTVTDQQIGPVASALASAESDQARAAANASTAEALVRSGNIFSVSDVLASPVIVQLRAQRSALLSTLADLRTRYGENFPDVVKARDQVAEIEKETRDEAARTVAHLRADARSAGAHAASLRSQLATLKSTQSANNRAAVEADSLQREVDADRATYAKLADQAQQAGQQAAVVAPIATVIQWALVPTEPAFPGRKVIALLVTLAGSILAATVAFGLELMESSVSSEEGISGAGFRSLGTLPISRTLKGGRKGQSLAPILAIGGRSAEAEAYRALALRLKRGGSERRTLAVTSCLPGEGKTHVALNLAHVWSRTGERTIIVDCDFRRPRLSGIVSHVGADLVDVLGARAPLTGAFYEIAERLCVLPIREPILTGDEAQLSEPLLSVVEELAVQFDRVILDLPPLFAVSLAERVASSEAPVLLVARWSRTPSALLQTAYSRLAEGEATVLGCVLNATPGRSSGGVARADPAFYAKAMKAYYSD